MLHKINNIYIQVEHISSVQILKDDSFGGTLEISLLGQEPIHVICGDRAEAELLKLLKLLTEIAY